MNSHKLAEVEFLKYEDSLDKRKRLPSIVFQTPDGVKLGSQLFMNDEKYTSISDGSIIYVHSDDEGIPILYKPDDEPEYYLTSDNIKLEIVTDFKVLEGRHKELYEKYSKYP